MTTIDVALCDKLVTRGVAGDAKARRELVDHLYPFWLSRIRAQKSVRVLGSSQDHVLDIAARLVEKLMDEAVLRGYLEGRATLSNPSFAQWIRKVTDNECTSYVRSLLGKFSKPNESDTEFRLSPKRLINEIMVSPVWEELGVRPPTTNIQTVGELVRFVETELPQPQVATVKLWLEGSSFDEMAPRLHLTASQARALLRSAIATLRRRFRVDDDAESTPPSSLV